MGPFVHPQKYIESVINLYVRIAQLQKFSFHPSHDFMWELYVKADLSM